MTAKRNLVHTAFLFLLPLIVAGFGFSVVTAAGLVLLMLLWRWMLSLAKFVAPEKMPALVLDSISASHFVEKVRWNMDRAGIDYVENASGGTLGAFFAGRTVPRLKIKTGAVRSQIGNSPEILRYLWGANVASEQNDVSHLQPTPERLALEKRLDRHGANLQVWVYNHILKDRALALHLWGANSPTIPAWQRSALRILFPVLKLLIRRSFRITPKNAAKAGHHIEELLTEREATLSDGRASILGGDSLNFTDFELAAMTGLWLQPAGYGGGKADYVLAARDNMPEAMQDDIERWCEDYPRTVAWGEHLYEHERQRPIQGH